MRIGLIMTIPSRDENGAKPLLGTHLDTSHQVLRLFDNVASLSTVTSFRYHTLRASIAPSVERSAGKRFLGRDLAWLLAISDHATLISWLLVLYTSASGTGPATRVCPTAEHGAPSRHSMSLLDVSAFDELAPPHRTHAPVCHPLHRP